RAALALRADHPAALAGIAWIEATTWDESLRRDDEMVTFAERAAELSGRRDLSVLDALAAAYAAGGRFDRAVEVARSAMRRADAAGLRDIAVRFADGLAFYQQNRPYRLPPPR